MIGDTCTYTCITQSTRQISSTLIATQTHDLDGPAGKSVGVQDTQESMNEIWMSLIAVSMQAFEWMQFKAILNIYNYPGCPYCLFHVILKMSGKFSVVWTRKTIGVRIIHVTALVDCQYDWPLTGFNVDDTCMLGSNLETEFSQTQVWPKHTNALGVLSWEWHRALQKNN